MCLFSCKVDVLICTSWTKFKMILWYENSIIVIFLPNKAKIVLMQGPLFCKNLHRLYAMKSTYSSLTFVRICVHISVSEEQNTADKEVRLILHDQWSCWKTSMTGKTWPTFWKPSACWDKGDEESCEEEQLRSPAERCHVCSEPIKGQKH